MTPKRGLAERQANRADRKSNAERRRTEEAIRSSKQLLQSVIDSTPDWIQVKDVRHRFILVNRSFAQALGQTPEDMIGRLDSEFLSQHLGGDVEAKLADIRARDAAALAGESMHDDREEIVLKDGQRRIFDLFKGPLRDASGAIYGVLTFRRDITERCLYEQDQRALAEQLRQAQKMEVIGHLTGGIAHDFNNILTAIFGFAELALLAPAVEQDPSLSRYLQRIVEAAARARDLVAQLLTFSHKRGVAADESSAIAPIVNEVTQLLRSTTPATISIGASVAENLPDVLISSIQLHQVLMNLGINASDAIGAKGSIEVRAARADVATATCASCHRSFGGPCVMIAVKDSGSGIREENLTKIFDPFFSTKEIGKGTGLGLSVLHGIVHSASGHVLVRSRPGEGAEFQVYLPYKPHAAARSPQHAAAVAGLEQVQGRVLLVDDEPDILEFMSALLESIGCSVIATTGSAEAWKVFSADPQGIDLVVTDQTMPDMTGAELARAMLAQRGDLPILLSTGYSTEIDEAVAGAIGIRRLLRKPVPSRVLCELVARYLKRPGAG